MRSAEVPPRPPAISPPVVCIVSKRQFVPRALIVDDHRIVRSGIRQLLKVVGIPLAGEAASAEEALEMLTGAEPNVVITDISMKGMDGIELTRQIRQEHPEVRVLIVSMHDEAHFIRKALEAGANGYVVKHNIDVALEEAIGALLDGHRYLCIDARRKVDVCW